MWCNAYSQPLRSPWNSLYHRHAHAEHDLLLHLEELHDTRADGCRVACARYGGPIAMVRDDRKLVVMLTYLMRAAAGA